MSSSHIPDRSFTALFVRRPVLAFVMNMLIVVAGLAAFFGVEIRELPDVDQPVISIRTSYDSASAETIDREVTGVIEGRCRVFPASSRSLRPRPMARAGSRWNSMMT